MRHLGVVAATAMLALLPQAASAVTYSFHSTELSALSPSPLNFDFTLDTATASVSGANTLFSNVTIGQNGTSVFGKTVNAAYLTNISSPLFFLVDTSLKPFYSGTGTGIRFNTGSFVIADGFTNGIGTLAVADVSVAAVPELSTWVSLFTGLAAIGAVLRFYRVRQRTTMRSA